MNQPTHTLPVALLACGDKMQPGFRNYPINSIVSVMYSNPHPTQSTQILTWPVRLTRWLCQLNGLLYAVAAGMLFYALRSLYGPQWVWFIHTAAGLSIAAATLYMLTAAAIERRSTWGLLLGILIGFFGILPPLALFTGRLQFQFPLPLPQWSFATASAMSLLLLIVASFALLPRRAVPAGFGPIADDAQRHL